MCAIQKTHDPFYRYAPEQEIEPIHVGSTNLAPRELREERIRSAYSPLSAYMREPVNTERERRYFVLRIYYTVQLTRPLHTMFYTAILRSRRYLLTAALNNSIKKGEKRRLKQKRTRKNSIYFSQVVSEFRTEGRRASFSKEGQQIAILKLKTLP